MKKLFVLLLTLIAMAGLLAPLAAHASTSNPERDVQGKITALASNALTIQTASLTSVTLRVNAATQVYKDNKLIPFTSLKVGNYVDAHYRLHRAIRIDKELPN